MDAWIDWISALIETHQAWAIPIVGLIAFGESLAVIGLLIPATAIMLLMGGLIGAGVLDPVSILLATIVGAILGDAVSYYVGGYFGPGLVQTRFMRSHRQGVARARLFFRKYGVLAVFLGRFFGPVRSTVPLVAGIIQMDHWRFQLANVGSAIVWAPLILAPGYVAARGAGEMGLDGEAHFVGLVAFVTVASIGLGIYGVIRMSAPRTRKSLARAQRP
jgi:membrane protein DedA with SNARE-associated domain